MDVTPIIQCHKRLESNTEVIHSIAVAITFHVEAVITEI